MQSPDHEHRQRQDQEVDEKIGNTIPAIELNKIDASPVSCLAHSNSRPVKRDWGALENGNKGTGEII